MSLFVLTFALAQAAAAPLPPPAASPPPASSQPVEAERQSWRDQIFISPAGEPFRVPEGQPYPVADWFAKADTNHDGRLTEAEFVADAQRFIATLDTNHDGTIDGTELEHYESVIAPEVHSGSFMYFGPAPSSEGDEGGGRKGGGGGTTMPSGQYADSYPMGAGKYSLINFPEPVAAMDIDISGRITRREVVEAAQHRFSLLDTKERGYLTLADLPETFAQGHKGMVRKKRR